MKDGFLKLLEAAKALITFIDEKNVFDKAAAGGCSGMDFHLSDAFYDLIIHARKAIKDVENGRESAETDGEASLKLFAATKALTAHIANEHAFDKVNDMGSVGIETYQSEAFIEVIQKTTTAIQEVEKRLQ